MSIFSHFLIASAHAQDAATGMPPEPSAAASLIPFLLIFAVFWLFLIRPQSKKFKAHQEMVKTLKKGDGIVTGGGIVGKVVKAVDGAETIEVEIAAGVVVEVTRATVTGLASSGEKKAPAAEKPAAGKKKTVSSKSAQSSSANDNG